MMDDTLTITITAEAVAWYAAIVATVSVVVQAAIFFRDRKGAKVTFRRDHIVMGDPRYTGTYTIVDVINTGRRPFTLTNLGMMYLEARGAVFVHVTPNLPCLLTEGQKATALVDQHDLRFEEIRSFEAYDASGRTFRANVASWPRRSCWAIRRKLKLI
jgi:hypothetical protein